jgi:hypothetical protein
MIRFPYLIAHLSPHRLRFIVVFILLTISIFVTSCGDPGCGPFGKIDTYTYIYLDDTSNSFEEIYYTDINKHYYASSVWSNLTSSTFKWELRISKPRTVMVLKTKKTFDTIEYAITKSDVKFYDEEDCDGRNMSMTIYGPAIISHTFDTIFVRYEDHTPSSSPDNRFVKIILYVK